MPDLIIIGAGPIGLACGIAAQRSGLSYLIIEKGSLVNSLRNYPVNMTFFSTSERLEIGGIPFNSIQAKPTRPEALEYYRRVMRHFDLQVHLYETVTSISGTKGDFRVQTTRGDYLARNLVLATGFYDVPNLMGVPGEDLPKVSHYYTEPWPYAGQRVLVVGGGNSAVDAALECYRKGADVTMVMRKAALDKGVKYWVLPDIENRIREGSIRAYFDSTVAAIHPDSVGISTPGGMVSVPNDFVLAMTGYRPNYTLLDQMGVELGDDPYMLPCFDRQHHETNISGLYLAGVVCGGLNTHEYYIENSTVHADRIAAHIASQPA